MDGVFFLYPATPHFLLDPQHANLPPSEHTTSSSVAPSSASPSVIVLTPPRRHMVASPTLASWKPVRTTAQHQQPPPVDLDVLKHLYVSYPDAFFLLASEPDPPVPASSSDSAMWSAEWQQAYNNVQLFFQQPNVCLRTCCLTLGVTAVTAFVPQPSSSLPPPPGESQWATIEQKQPRRHVLHLNSSIAPEVMRRQPWLKKLHEYPSTLFTVAQVAAAVFFTAAHVPSTSRQQPPPQCFRMTTSTALEVAAQCEWVGETELAGSLLECVARVVCARERDSICVARASNTQINPGALPSAPQWVEARGDKSARDGLWVDVAAETKADGDDENASQNDCIDVLLSVSEAYCTHTTTGASTGPTAALYPAAPSPSFASPVVPTSVISGCVDMQRRCCTPAGHHQGSLASTGASDFLATPTPWYVPAITHLIVCTTTSPSDSDTVVQAETGYMCDILSSLILSLHHKSRSRGSDGVVNQVKVQYKVHLCINGRDIINDGTVGVPETFGASPPLAPCSLDEALSRLGSSATCAGNVDSHEQPNGSGGGVAVALDRAGATLSHLHSAAHRRRLISLHERKRRRRQGQQTSPLHSDIEVPNQNESPVSLSGEPFVSTFSAVLLCVNERSVAQWMESGHPLLATAHEEQQKQPSHLHHFYDTPLYVCVLPSARASPSQVQRRLLEAQWVVGGLPALQTLCARTHGCIFLHEKNGTDKTLVHTMANRIHAWASAVYQSLHLCVFSQLSEPHSRDENRWTSTDSGSDTRASETSQETAPMCSPATPHCALCTPATVLQRHTGTVHMRLWRCAAASMSVQTPTSPFLLCDVLMGYSTNSQHIFSFARHTSPHNSLCGDSDHSGEWTVSRAVRVETRVAPLEPGPLRFWFEKQVALHRVLYNLAGLIDSEVDRLKTLFFAIMATKGQDEAQLGLRTVEEQQDVMDALQRITAYTGGTKQCDAALLHILTRLPILGSLAIRPPTESTIGAWRPSPAVEDAMLPQTFLSVLSEVAKLCGGKHLQQQRIYQHDEPITPSTRNISVAMARLVDLVYLKAQALQIHTLLASGDGEWVGAGSDSLPAGIPSQLNLSAPLNGAHSVLDSRMENSPPHFTAGDDNTPATSSRTKLSATGEKRTRVEVLTPRSQDLERFSDRIITPSWLSRDRVQRKGRDASTLQGAPQEALKSHPPQEVSERKGYQVRVQATGADVERIPEVVPQAVEAHSETSEALYIRPCKNVPPSPLSFLQQKTQLLFDVGLPSGGSADSVAAERDAVRTMVGRLGCDDDVHAITNASPAIEMAASCTRSAGQYPQMPLSVGHNASKGNQSVRLASPSETRQAKEVGVNASFRHEYPDVAMPPVSLPPPSPFTKTVASGMVDEKEGQPRDRPDAAAVRAQARLPAQLPEQAAAASEATSPPSRKDASSTTTADAPWPPPPRPEAPPPRPPCDLRWSSAAPPGALSASTPVSSIPALLATHLPASQVLDKSAILEVVSYAAGQLTVEVQDPTCAALAALQAPPPPPRASLHKREDRQQPAAYLALLSVDVTSSALRLWEVLPCATDLLLGSTGHVTEFSKGLFAELQPRRTRDRHTFVSRVPPSTVIAAVYIGLRRAAIEWVTVDDILWMSGIAVSLECPALDQAHISGVRADGFTLHWIPTSTPVNMVITELATPPAHTRPDDVAEFLPGDAGEIKKIEQTQLKSPAIIGGLHSGSIYQVELRPLHSARRIVRVSPQQPKQELALHTVVDATVRVRRMIAATSIALSPGYMRVRGVTLTHSAVTSGGVAKEEIVGVPASAASAPWCPCITGYVVCPLFSYATPALPASLLRNCISFWGEGTVSSGADAEVGHAPDYHLRLHLSIQPILARDIGDSRDDKVARDRYSGAHGDSTDSSGFQLTTVQDESAADPVGKGQIQTRHFMFSMTAGTAVEVAVSLRIQMRVERLTVQSAAMTASLSGVITSLNTVDASSATGVSIFDSMHSDALRACLGPFHVCGPVSLGTPSMDTREVELLWEGTHTNYEVCLLKKEGEADKKRSHHAHGDTNGGSAHSSYPAVERTQSGVTSLYHVRAQPSQVEEVSGSASPTLYRAKLRLGRLEPSTQYEAHVVCTENHVGDAQHCIWCTRPAPPTADQCHAVFDSSARQLHLHLIRHPPAQQCSPWFAYEAVLRPSDTAVVVPTAMGEKRCDSPAAKDVVQRVLDCHDVPFDSPIALELRQRAVWEPENLLSITGHYCGRSIAVSSESDPLVYYLVSNVRACDMTSTGSAVPRRLGKKNMANQTAEQPVVEVRWVCGSELYVAGIGVSFVVLNHNYRIPVPATTPGCLRLTVSQLRAAAAGEKVKEKRCTADTHEEREGEEYWWKGVLCITAFDGGSKPGPGQPRMLIAPDRCLTMLLPPPPPLLPTYFRLENYEEEVCIHVDAREIYDLYRNEYAQVHESRLCGSSDGVGGSHEAPPTASQIPLQQLAPLIHQRIRLSLEIHGVLDKSAGDDAYITAAGRRLILLDPSTASHQCVRIPLRVYREYDAHLRLGLHVSSSDDADVNGAMIPCITAVSDVALFPPPISISTVRLLVPRPSSLAPVDVPVPPAEPIVDLTVSNITSREALVHWTPPLSMLQHLRRKPNMVATYSVHLHPAQSVHEEPAISHTRRACSGPLTATDAVTQPTVYVAHEPYLRLTSLTPATPYVVVVGGTGFGDYYATIRFLTAPVIMKRVVAQVCTSVLVEPIVSKAASRLARGPVSDQRSHAGLTYEPPRKASMLQAVLPASSVVTWSTVVPTKGADGTATGASDAIRPHSADVITVVTHHTAALVAPTGELLRQWVSSRGTETAMHYEWDSVTSPCDSDTTTQSTWPHLEVIAHTEVLASEALVMPDAIHSGVHRRTRIDIIGMPRLAHQEKRYQEQPSCTLYWKGSSRAGYDVSWCLSPDYERVHHTRVKAKAKRGDPSSASALSLTIPVGASGSISRHGSAKTGVATGPVCVVVCITGARSSCGDGEDTTNTGTLREYDSLGWVREGESNMVMVGWILPPSALEPLPAASIVHQTASRSTLLLPWQGSPTSIRCSHAEKKKVFSIESEDAQERSEDVCTPHRDALRRSYTIETCAPRGKRCEEDVSSSSDAKTPQILPWTHAQYNAAGLPLRSGVLLVDVHTRNISLHGTAIELRCVDVVKDTKSEVWREIAAHVVRQHMAHVSRLDPVASGDDDEIQDEGNTHLQLRWLQSSVESRQLQHIPFLCQLSHLVLCGLQDAGSVLTPPLASSAMVHERAGGYLAPKPAKKRYTRRGSSNARPEPISSGRGLGGAPETAHTVSWIPLQTVPLTAVPAAHATGTQEEPCYLRPFVGEYGQDLMESNSATRATREELAKIQAWTCRGCPTYRARFAWSSNDEVFVLRIKGPYEEGPTASDTSARPDKHTEATATHLRTPSVQEVKKAVQTALRAGIHDVAAQTPQERTYTYARPCASRKRGGAADALDREENGALFLETDGTVSVARPCVGGSAPAKVPLCRVCIAEVDGLLPEAVYRVQVTGLQCGDAVLRAQFITPPSTLTQVIAIGEAALGGSLQQQPVATSGLTPKQHVSIHARHYSPHVYRGLRGGGGGLPSSAEEPRTLAPGLHYKSQTSLEVHSVATSRCLAAHVTHSSGGEHSHGAITPSERQRAALALQSGGSEGLLFPSAHEGVVDRGDPFPFDEAVFSFDVEEAVRVVAVHQLDVSLTSEKGNLFLDSPLWGPLLWPPEDPTPERGKSLTPRAPDSGGFGWDGGPLVTDPPTETPPTPLPAVVRRLRVQRLLCSVPQLPRIAGLAVRSRTPHSLQLTWHWWPGRCCGSTQDTDRQGRILLKDKERAYPSKEKVPSPEQPRTSLFVECCRLVFEPTGKAQPNDAEHDTRALHKIAIGNGVDKTGDVCTAVTAVSANPMVTLVPLRPGSLYEVRIREIALEEVADARSLAVRRRTATTPGSPSKDSESNIKGREVYAIKPAPLSGAAAAAVRALAEVSARPTSLVLPLRRGCAKPIPSEGSNAVSDGVTLPCDVAVYYILTPPAAAPAPHTLAALRRVTHRVRRRPGWMFVTLPSQADAPVHAIQKYRSAGVQVLSYTAVMMVPENVLYVPALIAEEMCQWWAAAQSHTKSGSETGVWEWWSRRVQSAMANMGQTATDASRWSHVGRYTTADSTQHSTSLELMPVDYCGRWNAELARRILGRTRDGSAVNGADALNIRVAPVEVRKLQGRKRKGSVPAASWEYPVPVEELVYHAATHGTAVRGEGNEDCNRAIYILRSVEVLPLQVFQLRGVPAGDNIIGGGQLMTVSHPPLSVKPLQLIRDLRVQGTATLVAAESTSPVCAAPKQCMKPTTVLHVEWKWPAWAYLCDAKPKEGVQSALSTLTPPPCALRVQCEPLPAAVGGIKPAAATTTALDGARGILLEEAVNGDCKDAVFVQHVKRGECRVDITGLAPATLYKVLLSDVRIYSTTAAHDDGNYVRGEDACVVALTPPALSAEKEVPELHYRLLNNVQQWRGPTRPSPPLGAEVCFQLPAAYRQSQGLLLSYYAVLVNLDAIDVGMCRTAQDFIAVAQEMRLAPQMHSSIALEPHSSVQMLRHETPVVYHNTSTKEPLSATVTLRRSIKQHHAIVFFTSVCYDTNKAGEVLVNGSTDDSVDAHVESHAPPAPILYSTPVVVPVRHTLPAHTSFDAWSSAQPPCPTSSTTDKATTNPPSTWHHSLLLPTRLHVHNRTRESLVLRWQLNLRTARLSDEARQMLLDRGVFTVSLAADAALSGLVKMDAGSCIGSDADNIRGARIPPVDASSMSLPLQRTVFYRCSAAVTSPPSAAVGGDIGPAVAAPKMCKTAAGGICRIPARDFITSLDNAYSGREHNDASTGDPTASLPLTHELTDEESCLTYEFVYPCPTYAAAHMGYTATVTLFHDWWAGEVSRKSAANTNARQTAPEGGTCPPSADPKSLSLYIPPVLLPLPVQRVFVVHLSDTACTVQWITAETERPAAYAVECVQHEKRYNCGLPDYVTEQEQELRSWIQAGPQQQNLTTFVNLSPHTTYTIRVTPHNTYGEPCPRDNATVTVQTEYQP